MKKFQKTFIMETGPYSCLHMGYYSTKLFYFKTYIDDVNSGNQARVIFYLTRDEAITIWDFIQGRTTMLNFILANRIIGQCLIEGHTHKIFDGEGRKTIHANCECGQLTIKHNLYKNDRPELFENVIYPWEISTEELENETERLDIQELENEIERRFEVLAPQEKTKEKRKQQPF